jgi:hypothetical protein
MPIANEVSANGIHPITNKWPNGNIGSLEFGFDAKTDYTNNHTVPIIVCNVIVKKVLFFGETEDSFVSICTCNEFAHCTSHRSPAYPIGIKEGLLKDLDKVTRKEFDIRILVRYAPPIHENDTSVYKGINSLRCTHGDMIIEVCI